MKKMKLCQNLESASNWAKSWLGNRNETEGENNGHSCSGFHHRIAEGGHLASKSMSAVAWKDQLWVIHGRSSGGRGSDSAVQREKRDISGSGTTECGVIAK